ncbi:MAG: hypothetical protein IKT14_05100 [Clostridiales bacterium]|nr:hypothetical protein [Clostridiales bacterium]
MSNRHKMFSIWKIIGFVIALGALGYKLLYTATYFDSIYEWWSGLIFIFFIIYLTDLVIVANSFTRGIITMCIAIGMAVISVGLICFDGLALLAFAASLDGTPLIERGFYPLSHLLNIVACIFDLIGFLSIRRKEKKKSVT